jgi:hypothetical protein
VMPSAKDGPERARRWLSLRRLMGREEVSPRAL